MYKKTKKKKEDSKLERWLEKKEDSSVPRFVRYMKDMRWIEPREDFFSVSYWKWKGNKFWKGSTFDVCARPMKFE